MTEKDAAKCREFAGEHCWYVPVEVAMDTAAATSLLDRIAAAIAAGREAAAGKD